MSKERSIARLISAQGGPVEVGDAQDRGYLSHVLVEIDGDRLYPVYFYNIDGLTWDLLNNPKLGDPCVAETGMIVVPEITLATLQDAVQVLCNSSYFDFMIPITREQLANADLFHGWPPKAWAVRR